MRRLALVLTLLASSSLAKVASAQSIIKRPGDHPRYSVEVEPHGLLGPFSPPGDGGGTGFGAGARFTIPIVHDGFLRRVNDSVGIGFGADWLFYDTDGVAVGSCAERVPGPAGTTICRRVAARGATDSHYVFLPVVMQWNFWIHRKFSAFGEPGLVTSLQFREADDSFGFDLAPALYAGGRWHFAERTTLTFRIGYPTLSVGVSFLL